jgi:pimeloyl-ACP methyl ester carboxylesterase
VRRIFTTNARPPSPWAWRRAGEDYGQSAEPNWRAVDWLTHLRQTEIAGRRVNYLDIGEGEGPPVVFVHGVGGQWQNWLENIPRVARERRVIVPDLPGFGLSEDPPDDVSISGYGRFIEALCDQLGLDEVALVGNSMGGFVAAETAIRFPERAERLALVSAAGITSADLKRHPGPVVLRLGAALATYSAARLRRVASRPMFRHFGLILVARHPARLKPDLVYEGLMKGTGKRLFDDALRATLDYDFRERLGEIRCPTLIVWGDQDVILPVEDASEFERLIPDSRKVVLEDVGHVPQLERPEAFNQCLLEFLAREPVGEATVGTAAGAAR